MSAAEPASDLSVAEVVTPSKLDRAIKRVDSAFDRLGDWCNPILVKEARQALKSKQFVWTFGALLFGAWVWSFVGTLLMMPGIYYVPGGRAMLLGYYWVLAMPMMLVAPMAAHRSLVAEREDGTFEVLSITSLSSYQIILGKLASAVLQLIIYFTALVPCVAFTYILRGVDLPSIVLLSTSTFLTAVFLIVIGLFMATIATTRSIQSLMMICLLLLIILAETLHGQFAIQLLDTGIRSDDMELAVLLLAVFTFYVATSVFLILAAASCISPASENKSTRLRIMMIVVHALALFWLVYSAYYMQEQGREYNRSLFQDFLPGGRYVGMLIVFSGSFYWILMGGLMLGEPESLSSRVKRGLPSTFAGRMLLTWLNPGPGTGMVFALASFSSVVCVAIAVEELTGFRPRLADKTVLYVGVMLFGYMMFFLGITRLLINAVRGKGNVTPFVSMVATALMMSLACIIPYAIGMYYNNFRPFMWNHYQLTNWTWTLLTYCTGTTAQSTPWYVLILGLGAGVLNMWLVGRDVMVLRISTPKRVLEELESLKPPVEDEVADPFAPSA